MAERDDDRYSDRREPPRARRRERDDDRDRDPAPRSRPASGGKSNALLIVLAVVGVFLLGVFAVCGIVGWTGYSRYTESRDRFLTGNNLKIIGMAMLEHENEHRHFPPGAIRSKDGKPLLSWRVAILPYIEQDSLYRQFKLDEPWD